MNIKKNDQVWSIIKRMAQTNIEKYSKKVVQNSIAEEGLIEQMKKQNKES